MAQLFKDNKPVEDFLIFAGLIQFLWVNLGLSWVNEMVPEFRHYFFRNFYTFVHQ